MNYNVNIPLLVAKRTKFWIAYSPHLKTYGYSSKGPEDAIKDFDRAIETFFFVHEKLNTLNKVLLKLGWERIDNHFNLPKFFNTELGFGSKSKKIEHKIAVPVM